MTWNSKRGESYRIQFYKKDDDPFFFKQHGPPCLLFFSNVETFEDHLFAGQMEFNTMNTSYTISSHIMALAGTTGTSVQKKKRGGGSKETHRRGLAVYCINYHQLNRGGGAPLRQYITVYCCKIAPKSC